MASYPLAEMRAIPPYHLSKLKALRIRSTTTLLERTATQKLRKQLAELTNIKPSTLLDWANIADLTRVRGIALDYAELLNAVGVDTVRDLKRRNAAKLVERMAAMNQKKKCVDLLPSEKRVAGWIEAAKTLPPIMDY
jgi:hypothetical protein